MKGKFIVFEGIDGVGKSTQLKLLSDRLTKLNIPHYNTAECTNGPIGKFIREEFLTGKTKIDSEALNMLFAADRMQHIKDPKDGILSKIENGINVLCDRYYLSSLAYNNYMYCFDDDYEEHIKQTYECNIFAIKHMKPDLTICLHVPPTVAIKNIEKRNGIKNIYDDLSKLENLTTSYAFSVYYLRKESYLRKENIENIEKIEIIDGRGSIEEVSQEIWSHVYPLLKDQIKEEQ